MIQLTIQIISNPLLHIINLSFTSGTVPNYLKISRIIPSFNSGDKSVFGNYRPISILPALSKLFEKAYYNRLANYLHKCNILSSDQYGFRKGYSTSYALIDLYDKISCSLDNREIAIGVFCDLSKLEHYGFVVNRLLDRLFYSIAILFADDTNIFFSHKDLSCLLNIVNQEMLKFSQWLKVNKLSQNIDKTKFILFKPRQKKIPQSFRIAIDNNKEIKRVKETIFLGVIIDEN